MQPISFFSIAIKLRIDKQKEKRSHEKIQGFGKIWQPQKFEDIPCIIQPPFEHRKRYGENKKPHKKVGQIISQWFFNDEVGYKEAEKNPKQNYYCNKIDIYGNIHIP